MRVLLGNPAAKDAASGDPLDGNQITTVTIPDTAGPIEAFTNVTAPDGVWANHSQGDPPDWVESDDATLASLLSQHFGCRVGRPKGWKEAGQ